MQVIVLSELIVTCEACGSVKKFLVKDEPESIRLFGEFTCENKCGKNLYSFITVGTLRRK